MANPQASELNSAIQYATPERLREVVTSVCLENETIFKAVYQKLMVDSDEGFDLGDPADDESVAESEASDADHERLALEPNTAPIGPSPGVGNKRKRYEICDQCDKEYDVVANTKISCLYHRGTFEINRRI